MNLFKKKRGLGLTSIIVILGIVAFTAAITAPKIVNNGALTKQKNIQTEASTILKDAKTYIKDSDLPSLGVQGNKEVTEEVFNSLEVVKVVNFLNLIGYLNGFKANSLLFNNPNLNLGDLKVITNIPAKDLILDDNGHLAKAPYIAQR